VDDRVEAGDQSANWTGIGRDVLDDPHAIGRENGDIPGNDDIINHGQETLHRDVELSSRRPEAKIAFIGPEATTPPTSKDNSADRGYHLGSWDSYCSLVSRVSTCDGSESSMTIIQPSPYGS